MENIQLAVIDDNQIIRESLQDYMDQKFGIHLALIAGNLNTFFLRIEQSTKPVDIVLLDFTLPNSSALDNIRMIQSKLPNSDIILFTSVESEQQIFKGLCAGAISFLSKRTPLSKLHEAIYSIYRGGSFMSPSIARKIAQHYAVSNGKAVHMTSRQYDIIQGIVDGLSYRKIAEKYNISINSVRDHIKKIYRNLHINSKQELIQKLMEGELTAKQ